MPTDLPHDGAWSPWSPAELLDRMRGCDRAWYIVGGLALSLWTQTEWRSHEDIEFCVRDIDAEDVRSHLAPLECVAAQAGQLKRVAANSTLPTDVHQFWLHDPVAKCWRCDMMIDRGTADEWRYKRDLNLSLPRSLAVRETPSGIRVLAPAIVLLFKAKQQRPKDDIDFEYILPRLEQDERVWLRDVLQQYHPAHPWLMAW